MHNQKAEIRFLKQNLLLLSKEGNSAPLKTSLVLSCYKESLMTHCPEICTQ